MNTYFKTLGGKLLYRSDLAAIKQNLSYRWLVFQDDSCIQTLVNRRRHQNTAMAYLEPFTLAIRHQPGSTCLLGLGGGAVLHSTAPYLQPHPITAVESSAEVIALGHKFFWLDEIKTLKIVAQEAHLFMANSQIHFDHILIDLYFDNGFPKTCSKPEFFDHCKQRLTTHGFLALNLVGIQQHFTVLQHLKAVFNQATICIPVPTTANLIVLASHCKSSLMEMIALQPRLKKMIWDPQYGCMAQFQY